MSDEVQTFDNPKEQITQAMSDILKEKLDNDNPLVINTAKENGGKELLKDQGKAITYMQKYGDTVSESFGLPALVSANADSVEEIIDILQLTEVFAKLPILGRNSYTRKMEKVGHSIRNAARIAYEYAPTRSKKEALEDVYRALGSY